MAKTKKNPKRVAAGKAMAEKMWQAHEAQEKALVKAKSIIANNQVKQAAPPVVDPPMAVERESPNNVLTTTQWSSVISIFVSFVGIYYKREEIKSFLTPKTCLRIPRHVLPHHQLLMPRHELPHHRPVPKRKGGICRMDSKRIEILILFQYQCCQKFTSFGL